MLICQVTDLHVCAPGRLAFGSVDTNAMTERALSAIASLHPAPEAVLVTGDLANGGGEAEYLVFLSLIRRHLSIPVYVIPGNHDRREPLRHALSGLPGLTAAPGFLHYVVEDLPVRLVMLDTQVPDQNYGELCAERLEFLERALASAPQHPTIIAMHHPPLVCGIGFMDRDNLRNTADFAAVVARHRQVQLIVCGHVHRAVMGTVAGIPVLIAPSPCHQVALSLAPGAAGAFVLEPPAFVLHRWTAVDGLASHVAHVGPSPGPFPFTG